MNYGDDNKPDEMFKSMRKKWIEAGGLLSDYLGD